MGYNMNQVILITVWDTYTGYFHKRFSKSGKVNRNLPCSISAHIDSFWWRSRCSGMVFSECGTRTSIRNQSEGDINE